jgi:phosphoglycolate phosphatase
MAHAAELTYHEFDLAPPSREAVAASVGLGAGALFAGHPDFQNPARLAAALESYWIHFADTAIVKHRLYDGVPLMLARLKRQGHRIYLVTVLPTRYAKRVLHQFDLLLAFDEVFGSTPADPDCAKGDLLAHLHAQGVLAQAGFLVGDRAADLLTAREHGLRPLGVTYGFARPGELQAAGAEVLFDSVPQLDAWLQRELPGAEVHDPFSRSE